MRSYPQELSLLWHCRKRWGFCRSLLVAKFLSFNSGECAVLKKFWKEDCKTAWISKKGHQTWELSPLSLSSWHKRLSCPGKELDKNRQVLPSLRRRLCSDWAWRHQVPFCLSWTYPPRLLSSSCLRGLCCRTASGYEAICWGEVLTRLLTSLRIMYTSVAVEQFAVTVELLSCI